jgi:Uma2 family endonuclease
MKSSSYVSVEEYLTTEPESPERREYVDGQVFAMSGATAAHNLISGNLFALLHAHLSGGSCRVYMADMKVRIKTGNCFYYPDVMVTCEPLVAQSVYNVAPVFIAEVLSPSTAQIDRREKLLAYRQILSLAEYMIVSQDSERIELYRRDADGHLVMTAYEAGEHIQLISVPGRFILPVDSLYSGAGVFGSWESQ